jgi:uncharacterized phage protein (TIGR02218 family)
MPTPGRNTAASDGSVTWVVSLPKYVFLATIDSVSGRGQFHVTGIGGVPDHWTQWGVCKFLTGPNAGFSKDIADNVSSTVSLLYPCAYQPQIGDTMMLLTGCDKKIGTCFGKFANQINFRGFPFMPGTDQYFQVGLP